jgi:PTH1 family peptidyl-tRNA hydrolase
MKVVLGLGNPGARYAATRHNIGWIVLDAVAEKLRTGFVPAKGDFHEAHTRFRGRDLLLVKPTTYMNNSGIAAMQLVERYGVGPSDMLVIVDEIQFPVGRIQLKGSGSSGGHNGLESLIYHLGSHDFPRLRCGVGSDFQAGEMADYVLSPFPAGQEEIVCRMTVNACEAVLAWTADGTAQAMNRINRLSREAERQDAVGGSPDEEERKGED